MNIMSKVTLRQMRLNKRRTIVTIIGVIIAVAMFTAVSTLGGSFLDFGQQAAISNKGNYHVEFDGVSNEDLTTIGADEAVESYYAIHEDGLAQLPSGFGSKQFLSVKSITPETMEDAGIRITEGRLPENDSELVLSQSIRERNPDDYQIGETITLELGERRLKNPQENAEGELLGTINGDVPYLGEDEMFRPLETKTYTIVGFATMLPQEPSYAPSLTAVTALDTDKVQYRRTLDVYLKVKQVNDSIYDWGDALHETIGNGDTDYSYNTSLLMFQGENQDIGFMRTLYTFVAILFLIIFIGSIALIYNAFAISVSERSMDFGLLSSIGATKRQKRRSVLLEALLILVIAVPLGILGGYLGLWGVFTAVNPAINALVEDGYIGGDGTQQLGLRLVFSPVAMGVAVGMSILTVLVSAWIPAVRASRVSPIEAIRQTKDVKLTPRSVKTSRLTRALFGIEGDIAAKNMKRNKKRYRIAIMSFVISLVLFLSASSFTHFLTGSVDVATGDYNYNVAVSLWKETDDQSDVTQETLQAAANEISHMEGVKEFTVVGNNLSVQLDEKVSLASGAEKIWDEAAEKGNTLGLPTLRIYALHDETLKAYCEKVGADYDTMQDGENFNGIFVNDLVWKEGNEYTKFSLLDRQSGDTLVVTAYGYDGDGNITDSHDRTIRIEKITDQVPIGFSATRSQDTGFYMDVFVSEAVYEKYLSPLSNSQVESRVYLSAEDSAKITDAVEERMQEPAYRGVSIYCFDLTSEMRMIGQLLFLINTFSYVFIALISAIGVANIFNTISTSIILRRREFAMLKSVGMSPRGFHKMLFFESLLYGLKSLLWGLPISFGVMVLLYLVLKNNFQMPFSVPWLQVIIGIVVIFAIVMITVLYAAAKIRKENVIEGLRDRNL